MKLLLCLILPLFINCVGYSNLKKNDSTVKNHVYSSKKRLNFFISSRIRKLDPALISTQLQAIATSRLGKKNLYYLFVDSAQEMANRITKILASENALIGNIWFDSHGHFSKRRSLFEIGKDEFNYQSLKDTLLIQPLAQLAVYCDTFTKAGIGSCYGGATFSLPAIGDIPESRMNGDSLTILLSAIMNHCTVYASESFVMSRIGIFSSRYKLAGCPFRKKFRDPLFRPIWEKLGTWNSYDGRTRNFNQVATVSLSMRGNIFCKRKPFLSFSRNKKKQQKILMKLKSGNYDLGLIYREQ